MGRGFLGCREKLEGPVTINATRQQRDQGPIDRQSHDKEATYFSRVVVILGSALASASSVPSMAHSQSNSSLNLGYAFSKWVAIKKQ